MNQLTLAKQILLDPAGIAESEIEKTFSTLLGKNIDDADLYFQSIRSESWTWEDGILKEGTYSQDKGVGVRAISGEKTGFAYSNDVVTSALTEAAEAAKCIAKQGGEGTLKIKPDETTHQLYQPADPLDSLSETEKVSLLKTADAVARGEDARVKQVIASLHGTYETVLVVGKDGKLHADIRPLVRLNVSVIVEENGRREKASHGGGGRFLYRTFIDNDMATAYAKEAVRQALVQLDAEDAPAGLMPVVLGPGWPGVLLHEAVGHGLEGDFNRKGSSAFSGRIGERVAMSEVTVVDDGTIEGRRGSLNIDDEGTTSKYNVLIENGILKGYMFDKLNAKLMGVESTGNGRRESFAHLPMPRMTNTYMLAGKHDPQEIIKSVDRGLYAVNFGGGQVDITSGKFVFSATEAYLIENGKITKPVKGATLIGNGPDVLTKVSLVGNDLQLDSGVGTCGKDGQSVPVGVGQPTLKIDELTVGGTKQ